MSKNSIQIWIFILAAIIAVASAKRLFAFDVSELQSRMRKDPNFMYKMTCCLGNPAANFTDEFCELLPAERKTKDLALCKKTMADCRALKIPPEQCREYSELGKEMGELGKAVAREQGIKVP